MNPPFILFGRAHLIALAMVLAVPLLLTILVRCRPQFDPPARWLLAALLLPGWLSWYAVSASRGELSIATSLPLNLCDWAAIVLFVALVRPRQIPYELGYFWGLGGTLQGLITPDIAFGFPDPQFLCFFAEHGGVVAALFYLTLGTGLRPYWASLPRVIVGTFAYVGVAALADWLLDANYGFLRAKPPHASLMSLLSPWPWYIPELVLIGIAFVLLYYLPFAAMDAVRRTRKT
ncbi:MAG TPA: TIGR02206 family membrane protein [Rhizomicrobium sp.]|jgi:hypothetical integral membrane protein (TIGR02206 family)|nr:TIGR02206 family membrane protein [Rhizomicrobium sp.]